MGRTSQVYLLVIDDMIENLSLQVIQTNDSGGKSDQDLGPVVGLLGQGDHRAGIGLLFGWDTGLHAEGKERWQQSQRKSSTTTAARASAAYLPVLVCTVLVCLTTSVCLAV